MKKTDPVSGSSVLISVVFISHFYPREQILILILLTLESNGQHLRGKWGSWSEIKMVEANTERGGTVKVVWHEIEGTLVVGTLGWNIVSMSCRLSQWQQCLGVLGVFFCSIKVLISRHCLLADLMLCLKPAWPVWSFLSWIKKRRFTSVVYCCYLTQRILILMLLSSS